MNWDEIAAQVWGQLREHGVKVVTGALLAAAGWYLGRRRARADWTKREFYDRLNISLNTMVDGTLRIRTLSEKRLDEIYLNKVAADAVQSAAQRTTLQDCTLPLSKEDYWFYLNAVLNELSEQFAHGFLLRDLGAPVRTGRYLVSLTSEAAGEVRMRKTRAMVVQKSLLTNLPGEAPQFESGHHGTRWATLNQLAAEYRKNPWKFIEVELCV